MRDPEFEVSSVRESDVIHANKKDVNCIFRVTTSLMDPPGVRHQCLMLADTESEKTKWVVALNELHRQVTLINWLTMFSFVWQICKKNLKTAWPAALIRLKLAVLDQRPKFYGRVFHYTGATIKLD